MMVVKEEKKYTKDQIREAVAYWESELGKMDEGAAQAKADGGITDIPMWQVLESLDVYDKVIGVQYGLKGDYDIKFPDEFADRVKLMVSSDRSRAIRKYYLGVKFISDYELEEYEDAGLRKEKIDDARYILQEDWNTRFDPNDMFKPKSTMVAEGVRYKNIPGVAICVLYAFW